MATSSKDIEILWKRYSDEGVKKGISVTQFFESNGVPYRSFEKWYKTRFQQPSIVDCVVDGTPGPSESVATVSQEKPQQECMISHVNIMLSNGIRIEPACRRSCRHSIFCSSPRTGPSILRGPVPGRKPL